MKDRLIEITDTFLKNVSPVDKEKIPLEDCFGRVLGEDLTALDNVPSFERSPLDGYAFAAEDTAGATEAEPVTLKITEEVPAGAVPSGPLSRGCAVKILTGSPIPKGADCVIRYENTTFTDSQVTIYAEQKAGKNVIAIGEDIRKGTVMAREGSLIDWGTMGSLAAQNNGSPCVYRRPRIGLISTGPELIEVGQEMLPGKIYNTSRHTLSGEVTNLGCRPVFLGSVRDDARAIAELISKGIETCDGVFLTGGVSAGDYDLTPAAIELAGGDIIFKGSALKPCAYGVKGGTLIGALTGSPASAAIDFAVVCAPILKKLSGRNDYRLRFADVIITEKYRKGGPLRGFMEIGADGICRMRLSQNQGHVMVSSLIGCNAVALTGKKPAEIGDKVTAVLLDGMNCGY